MERVDYGEYEIPVDTEASFLEFTLNDPICIVAISSVRSAECKIRERNPSETPISKRGYDLDLEIWLKTRICQFCQMHV